MVFLLIPGKCCQCPEGQIMGENGHCIPKEECTCDTCLGHEPYVPFYEEGPQCSHRCVCKDQCTKHCTPVCDITACSEVNIPLKSQGTQGIDLCIVVFSYTCNSIFPKFLSKFFRATPKSSLQPQVAVTVKWVSYFTFLDTLFSSLKYTFRIKMEPEVQVRLKTH